MFKLLKFWLVRHRMIRDMRRAGLPRTEAIQVVDKYFRGENKILDKRSRV